MNRFGIAVLTVIAFDQLTKFLASALLSYGEPKLVFPMLAMTLLHNTGAAFSFLSDAGGWQRWVFVLLAIFVAIYCFRVVLTETLNRWLLLGYTLLFSGAIGNAIDRLVFGYVVDFIHVYWKGWSFPAFNVADMSITLATGFLLMGWYCDARHRSKLQN